MRLGHSAGAETMNKLLKLYYSAWFGIAVIAAFLKALIFFSVEVK